ncbi:PREDICTED: uncharacterized protein LOC108614386 [Drosophila arizonae]|uniref:Uncharacterized protein LOC108614386 n=2 Tax=mojavensis species complex TaxID=198037 RepID=A0ABM1P9U4_DROAR|nr:PREDICTED: uncharacterized protein LOC108614386 [Drosophila arizonae]
MLHVAMSTLGKQLATEQQHIAMELEKQSKPTVSYHLFLYREELARRQRRLLRLSRTKIEITDELISKTVRNIKSCSMDDLKAVNRELLFKRKLRHNVSKLRKLAKQQ